MTVVPPGAAAVQRAVRGDAHAQEREPVGVERGVRPGLGLYRVDVGRHEEVHLDRIALRVAGPVGLLLGEAPLLDVLGVPGIFLRRGEVRNPHDPVVGAAPVGLLVHRALPGGTRGETGVQLVVGHPVQVVVVVVRMDAADFPENPGELPQRPRVRRGRAPAPVLEPFRPVPQFTVGYPGDSRLELRVAAAVVEELVPDVVLQAVDFAHAIAGRGEQRLPVGADCRRVPAPGGFREEVPDCLPGLLVRIEGFEEHLPGLHQGMAHAGAVDVLV